MGEVGDADKGRCSSEKHWEMCRIIEWLCCTPETNVTLDGNYSAIKIKSLRKLLDTPKFSNPSKYPNAVFEKLKVNPPPKKNPQWTKYQNVNEDRIHIWSMMGKKDNVSNPFWQLFAETQILPVGLVLGPAASGSGSEMLTSPNTGYKIRNSGDGTHGSTLHQSLQGRRSPWYTTDRQEQQCA